MNTLLIIYGEVGSGKTTTAEHLMRRVIAEGYEVGGILSLRVIKNEETIGYDAYNVRNESRFPIARLYNVEMDDDWDTSDGLKYVFSRKGIQACNMALKKEANMLNRNTVIFFDEFGHLEQKTKGMYPGLMSLRESPNQKDVLIVMCRTNKVDNVIQFFEETDSKILTAHARQEKIYESMLRQFPKSPI